MISNRLVAFLAEGVARYFALDEINLIFQKAGFEGREARHWTRLGRAQSWLRELKNGFGSAKKLSALLAELMYRSSSQNQSYLSFLHELNKELENELLENPKLKTELGDLRVSRPSSNYKLDSSNNDKRRGKVKAKLDSQTNLSKQTLESLYELLQQTVPSDRSIAGSNRVVLPIDGATFDQLEREVRASIELLGAPRKPKRVVDYLREFRLFLKELKLMLVDGTAIAATLLLLLAALQKCIEAINALLVLM
jgi:hypothetical protein